MTASDHPKRIPKIGRLLLGLLGLTTFRAAYPQIALEIIGSVALINMGNREADLALPVVVNGGSLPNALYASRLCACYTAFYCHRDLLRECATTSPWLLGLDEAAPDDWQPQKRLEVATGPQSVLPRCGLSSKLREPG
ncbi:hypothetical protein [Sphingobium sp. B11D3D]|uniref:hypothetical protein n=1 Tax=Sphingobium sp. B11D3D TaxID=2940576 RepID=UPI002224CE91|nr:hypothetical protein [Sphingobium sp. B11D3D]